MLSSKLGCLLFCLLRQDFLGLLLFSEPELLSKHLLLLLLGFKLRSGILLELLCQCFLLLGNNFFLFLLFFFVFLFLFHLFLCLLDSCLRLLFKTFLL